MVNSKRTKIVATLGPATSNPETIREMILEGVDVFRINFSHANYESVRESIKMIRELSEELQKHIAVLADLQGPKLRIGVMKEEVIVHPGDTLEFHTGKEFEGKQ